MNKIKLSKKFQARNRLMRNMLSSLILFEQIQTTPQKAKAVKAKASSFIAKIKKVEDEVALKRYIAATLYGGSKQKAFDYKDKYTSIKIYRIGNRFGDNAEQVIVKLGLAEEQAPKKETTKKVNTKSEK
jgi:ribosomal protein L17